MAIDCGNQYYHRDRQGILYRYVTNHLKVGLIFYRRSTQYLSIESESHQVDEPKGLLTSLFDYGHDSLLN